MSTLLLLDTDVFSYFFRNDPLRTLYRPHVKDHSLAFSFMTVAEVFEGAYRAAWGEKRLERLEQAIRLYLVLPSSDEACKLWAEVRTIRRHQPISAEDAWIAATALEYGCTLVTNNASDFRGIPGLTIITEV